MRKSRNLAIAAVAAATMLVGVLPAGAHAAALSVVTVDQHAGGWADVTRTGVGTGVIEVCDVSRDGFGVDVAVSYNRQLPAGLNAWDFNGPNNACVTKSIRNRGTVFVNVCLNRSGRSTPHYGAVSMGALFCSGWTPVRL